MLLLACSQNWKEKQLQICKYPQILQFTTAQDGLFCKLPGKRPCRSRGNAKPAAAAAAVVQPESSLHADSNTGRPFPPRRGSSAITLESVWPTARVPLPNAAAATTTNERLRRALLAPGRDGGRGARSALLRGGAQESRIRAASSWCWEFQKSEYSELQSSERRYRTELLLKIMVLIFHIQSIYRRIYMRGDYASILFPAWSRIVGLLILILLLLYWYCDSPWLVSCVASPAIRHN